MIIAGVAGNGDETGKAWEAFMEMQKMHPLKNQAGEEGYEIRLCPGAMGACFGAAGQG